jgi:hypothetical protein
MDSKGLKCIIIRDEMLTKGPFLAETAAFSRKGNKIYPKPTGADLKNLEDPPQPCRGIPLVKQGRQPQIFL